MVRSADVPLSPPARAAVDADARRLSTVLGGGDDYELLFCAPSERRDDIEALARGRGVAVTRIGRTRPGEGVVVLDDEDGELSLISSGYTHF